MPLDEEKRMAVFRDVWAPSPVPALSPAERRLVAAMGKTRLPANDPAWRAVEAACHAVRNGGPPLRAAVDAADSMPDDAPSYEKGWAWGLAFMLALDEVNTA